MATELATAYVSLVPSLQGAQGTIAQELGGAGTVGGKLLSSNLLGIVGKVAAPLGAALGIGKIISTGFQEAKDAAAGTAQLAAGIASTGNAANVSVGSLNNLASSIQSYSGQTDDSIVGAEKLLLTFTNIKNVGPDKIFDQATKAAADMAARMGGDASGNAILLGKALNDPVKGITALTRVGVSFTEQQKSQIAAMVQAGDTMGAQKVILGELNKEFGGSAAAFGDTFPGAIARVKRAFEDLSQNAIQGLLPAALPILNGLISAMQAVSPVVAVVGQALGTAFSGGLKLAGQAFQSLQSSLGPVFAQIGAAFAPALGQLAAAFGPLIPQLVTLWTNFSPLSIILKAVAPLLPQLAKAFGQLAATVGGALGSALKTLMPVFQNLATVISGALGQALGALLPVVTQVIGILGPILGTIIKALAPIITILANTFGQLITAVAPLLTPILQLISPLLQLVGVILTPLIQLFSALLTPILQLISPLISLLVPVLQVVVTVLTAIVQGVVAAITWFVQLVTGSQTAQAQLAGVWNAVLKFFSGIWNGIVGFFRDGITNAINFVKGLPQQVLNAIGNLGTLLYNAGRDMIQGLLNGAGSLLRNIGKFFLSILPGWIVDPFKAALGIHSPSTVFSGYGVNTVEGFVAGITSTKGTIASALSDMVPTAGFTLTGLSTINTAGTEFAARSGAVTSSGFVNNGTIQVTDEKALVDLVDQQQRRANALAGVGGVPS
jgi:phage-related protein